MWIESRQSRIHERRSRPERESNGVDSATARWEPEPATAELQSEPERVGAATKPALRGAPERERAETKPAVCG